MMQHPTLSGIMDRSAPPHIYRKYLPLSQLRTFFLLIPSKTIPGQEFFFPYLFASFCPRFFQDGAQGRDRFCESFLLLC
jgi:hypothetical protein